MVLLIKDGFSVFLKGFARFFVPLLWKLLGLLLTYTRQLGLVDSWENLADWFSWECDDIDRMGSFATYIS